MIKLLHRSAALLSGAALALSLPAAPAHATDAKPVLQCKLKTKSGLGYTVLTAGKGAMPGDADKVNVAYKGRLAADGTLFDESDNATFGVNEVVPGFGEGVKLLKEGGSIRLCIPAALGYGADASGPIPANSDLVFEVSLIGIKHATGPLAAAERSCTTKTASGLSYTILKATSGGSPGPNDYAFINYKGFLAATGALFDEADQVPLPLRGVVPGFAQGLGVMQKGGSAKLCIPAALAYGEKAKGPIPANSDLIFIVDMIDYKTVAELEAIQRQQQGQPQ